jgi:putative ABC transport system substrate-binding protein
MTRRSTLAALLAYAALPFASFAQQPGRTYRIGVLFSGGSATMQPHLDVVREQLARLGFVEGRNLQITWRGSGGYRHEDREVARELVATQPDVILTFASAATQAVQFATKSIPIVFTQVSDPIADGIVEDYAHPGGNTTGVSTHHRELLVKRFELLRELLPKAKRVVLLAPVPVTDTSFVASKSIIKDACTRLNFELIIVPISDWNEVKEARPEAMIVYAALGQRLAMENVIEVAAKLHVASIFPDAESVALGGLASYGTDPLEDTRLGTELLGRVLVGAKPGDQAVYQNSRFVLAMNVNTAKVLGITIPQSVRVRIDRLIE